MLGYSLAVDGVYLDRTQEAVRQFREAEGLPVGDVIDEKTWSALVDASYSMGDRTLYLRMPFFHGGDVRSLQSVLDVLGFIAGTPDGIFGPHTERALREFQTSAGLVDDGIAGASTFDAIERLRHAWEGKSPTTVDADEHMGFARAAEALEGFEACFYGLDEVSRGVASRVANLARATTSDAHIASADELVGAPSSGTLMIGITTDGDFSASGTPAVAIVPNSGFSKRLRTALDSARRGQRRMIVQIPARGEDSSGNPVEGERWGQHVAVVLLDALCLALG